LAFFQEHAIGLSDGSDEPEKGFNTEALRIREGSHQNDFK